MNSIHPVRGVCCAICYEELGNINTATIGCGHTFHYNCIFKWNSTAKSNCPMCRTEMSYLNRSTTIDDDMDLELMSDNTSPLRLEEQLIRTKSKLRQFLKYSVLHREQSEFYNIKSSCKDCSRDIIACDFCDNPFCACTVQHELFTGVNPFNKLYTTVFDEHQYDLEFYSKLGIDIQSESVDPTDMRYRKICLDCFSNRDRLLEKTLNYECRVHGLGGVYNKDALETISIKTIYYYLYFDNSNLEEPRNNLHQTIESFDTYEAFKDSVIEKFNIMY